MIKIKNILPGKTYLLKVYVIKSQLENRWARRAYKWNYKVCNLLRLVSLIHLNAFVIHLRFVFY